MPTAFIVGAPGMGDNLTVEVRYTLGLSITKNKLELENMSGRRVVTTYQDFSAKLDLANTMAALEYTTNEVFEGKSAHSHLKYQQITNETRLITKFFRLLYWFIFQRRP